MLPPPIILAKYSAPVMIVAFLWSTIVRPRLTRVARMVIDVKVTVAYSTNIYCDMRKLEESEKRLRVR